MDDRTVVHSTFAIERRFSATPERVFAAFQDPAKKRRWFAEGEGFSVKEYKSDFRVGGFERTRFLASGESPIKGAVLANDTNYHDIVPNRRVVFAYTMTVADKRISASLSTVELLPADSGTNLVYTEQAAFFEGADGPQVRTEGWRHLFEALEKELAG